MVVASPAKIQLLPGALLVSERKLESARKPMEPPEARALTTTAMPGAVCPKAPRKEAWAALARVRVPSLSTDPAAFSEPSVPRSMVRL